MTAFQRGKRWMVPKSKMWPRSASDRRLRAKKTAQRKAAERTVDGLSAAIGRLIDTFTPQECANYFAAAGYDAT